MAVAIGFDPKGRKTMLYAQILPVEPVPPPIIPPDPPVKEPEPDRLPDEEPLPNPDETRNPPILQ
jgi:hypothetical protein